MVLKFLKVQFYKSSYIDLLTYEDLGCANSIKPVAKKMCLQYNGIAGKEKEPAGTTKAVE